MAVSRRLDVRMPSHPVAILSTANDRIDRDSIHPSESFQRRQGVSHLVLQIRLGAIRRRRIPSIHAKAFDALTDCGRPTGLVNPHHGSCRHDFHPGHRSGSCRRDLHLVRRHCAGHARKIELQAPPPRQR